MKLLPALALGTASVIAVALLSVPATSLYYEAGGGEHCARCHEIRPAYDRWHLSSHRNTPCGACHGEALTLDMDFHAENFHRVKAHLEGHVPEIPRLGEDDAPEMVERCRKCHQQEFADWQSGPHSAGYRALFLDAKHNRQQILTDDCLRCHGMHTEGGIRDLVQPVDQRGPWRLVDPARADWPTMPCLACHTVHREGPVLGRRDRGATRIGAREEVYRPSLAFFDRREMRPVSISLLSLPAMHEGERAVKMSPDPRQRLCYQCHAPLADTQVRSGDDRTAVGVHEGLSCLACHQRHRMTTRASCADCHPHLSNCGIDVEKMDTTFLRQASAHNIHFVKCIDCHPKGVPPRKAPR